MYLGEQLANPCTQGSRATRRLILAVFSVCIPAESMEKKQLGTMVRTVFGEWGPQLGKVFRCVRRQQKSELPLKAHCLVLTQCVAWGYSLLAVLCGVVKLLGPRCPSACTTQHPRLLTDSPTAHVG